MTRRKHKSSTYASQVPWLIGRRATRQAILNRIYCYKDAQGRSLPSAPYVFPNGQGNTAKFLHGKANSEKWEKEFGPIYRIWAGTTPEV